MTDTRVAKISRVINGIVHEDLQTALSLTEVQSTIDQLVAKKKVQRGRDRSNLPSEVQVQFDLRDTHNLMLIDDNFIPGYDDRGDGVRGNNDVNLELHPVCIISLFKEKMYLTL